VSIETASHIPPSLDDFRETLKVIKEKTGKGDKQETVWYIRDRDDPKGERGSQRTVLSEAAIEWTVRQAYRSFLRMNGFT
jgi:hypothetical protein